MTVPVHMKIVIRGIFQTSPEEWTYGLKFKRDNNLGDDSDVSAINEGQVNSAITAFHAGALFTSQCWVTGWRGYAIGPLNKMEGNPKVVEYTPAQYVKGSSSAYQELDTSACVTSVADDRGPARFGRFFLPTPALSPALDGRWTVTPVTTLLTATTTFVKALADAIDLQGLVSSELLNISDVGGGAKQTVKRLRLGRVPDGQRRRRRSLLEEYVETGDIDW